MLRLEELDYDLPEGLIATTPAEPRDSARLCVIARSGNDPSGHAQVRDLPQFLRAGDLLVLNTTSVLPAWLEGTRAGTGGKFNGLYLGPGTWTAATNGHASTTFDAVWIVMLRGGHLREGAVLSVGDGVMLELLGRDEQEPGAWLVGVRVERTRMPLAQVAVSDSASDKSEAERNEAAETSETLTLLQRVGLTPIPPYIRKARKDAGLNIDDATDRGRYQTIFANAGTIHDGLGSVAAPTAGLHFTPGLLAELDRIGVQRASVVLHVGPGTFRPVETAIVEDHPIHSEWCSMSNETIEAIRRTRESGGRVVCVGTTGARVVETYAQRAENGLPYEEWIETRILITPGYRWRWTDGLLTNFHLPRSTLMAMVATLLEGGVPRLKSVYDDAIRERYRFYSYGDAMLVLESRT